MYAKHLLRTLVVIVTMLGAAVGLRPLRAQGPVLQLEAVAGEPFGVGRIMLDLAPQDLPEPLGIEGIGLSERRGRVLYPAIDNPAFGRLLRGLLGNDAPLGGGGAGGVAPGGPIRGQIGGILRGIADRPPRTTIFFLFRGAEPLELLLQARSTTAVTAAPVRYPGAHRRLLEQWWFHYAKPPGLLDAKPDYPPLVEDYLIANLARRLGQRLPPRRQMPSAKVDLGREIGLTLGTETIVMEMLQDRVLGLNDLAQPADQPLPEPVSAGEAEPVPAGEAEPLSPPSPIPPAPSPSPLSPPSPAPPPAAPQQAQQVPIEPIANRVPVECFYARFGRFNNFLWVQDTLAKWGGDAQNLISLRGLDWGLRRRIERQLVLKTTLLARVLGETVVADVAMVGTDMFFREGGSYGLLFHARNNLALAASLNQQRKERIGAGGVKEETVDLGGHPVSYLSSPDGTVRSYYVADGDFHFVTSSKTLARRFLETAAGQGSLGASPEFRHARSVLPLARNDTVWLYVSDAFFRNLTGPQYRIETARRLQAAADIDLVRLARLAAAAEGRPGRSIEELLSPGLLPPEFGPLCDGSHTVVSGEDVYDSLRGHLGSFLPIADVPVAKASQAEVSEYRRFAEFYASRWGKLDPIIAGVARKPLGNNREHVVIDLSACPWAKKHFDVLRQWLGPADQAKLAPVAGDMAAVDLTLSGERIFGGIQDIVPPGGGLPGGPPGGGGPGGAGFADGVTWFPLGRLRNILVCYVGTSGELGPLGILNVGIPPASDPDGYAHSPLPFGGWRRQYGGFTVFSFQHEVLDQVAPQLRLEQAARPAQVRLRVADLSNAQITPVVNNLAYARTRETSLGNLRLLHALSEQLHVPPADCREVAERLLDARLVCPLGGKYELEPGPPTHWTSTALQTGVPAAPSGGLLGSRAPPGYQAAPLRWFRGLELEATMTERTLSAHAEVIMQMPAKP